MVNNTPVIVVATGVMNAGGTESLIMETFRHASGRVKYILLIHYDKDIPTGVFDDEIKNLGIEKHYIGSIGKLGINGYCKAFKEFAKVAGNIDIVHSHLNAVGGIIAMAAKKAGVRHRICHCHADIHYTGNIISIVKSEVSLTAMKGIIELYATDRWACSAAAWKRLFMPWRKRVVIDNMIDTRVYLATYDKLSSAKQKFGLDGKFVVGAVGRVAPIKNYETILKALVGTDAHFVCFGRFDINNAYCRSLDDLAKELGIADHIHWMGNSNHIAEDIHCIDLFVMPSFTEGFGMAAIEAQAASIPSLLSSGVPDIVDTGIGLVKFLNPCNHAVWHEEIEKGENEMKSFKIIPDQLILKSFEEKHFDSPSAVREIEDRYIDIASK